MINNRNKLGVSRFVKPSIFIFAIILLASCAPAVEKPWQVSDLRALDPLDATDPSHDLIAVYTRSAGLEDHIRLDFLDVPDVPSADVYIALDTKPGGLETAHLSRLDLSAIYPEGLVETSIAYDLLLVIPTEGDPGVIDVSQSTLSTRFIPRIIRDPALDTLTVVFNRFDLPADYSMQVFVTPAEDHAPADGSGAISSSGKPVERARLLMAFSDVFSASTSAQSLRRWDGAHTGPYGERHGLHPLLDSAAQYHIPLALLDLKEPDSLSALDLTGGIAQLKEMWRNRLLILPDVAYGNPNQISLAKSIAVSEAFGFPVSKFLYGQSIVSAGYELQFFTDPDASSPNYITEWDGQKFLGVPAAVEEQTTPDGLTLETRRSLADALFNDGFVILGGDLPNSSWGDSDAGPAGMRYIAAHPWIQPLDADDLLEIGSEVTKDNPLADSGYPPEPFEIFNSQGQRTGFTSETLILEILSRLDSAPENPISESAWDMYYQLTAPVSDTKLAATKAQYLGDINNLLTAADWAQSPASQSTCDVDLNFDLIQDCVVANSDYFAVFQADGGRLVYLFSHDGKNPHQVIGPGWQFTAGMSDRIEWQPSLGIAADPSQIPGAFYDADSPWRMYSPTLDENGFVTFTSSDGITKFFEARKDGIRMTYNGPSITIKTGVALDPWRRHGPGWGKMYHARIESDTLTWRLDNTPSFQMYVPGGLIHGFNDTIKYLPELEDPNQAFPPGHYLPLPLALMEYLAFGGSTTPVLIK